MNALKQRYGDRGFEVLAVPCNQFHMEEPAHSGEELMAALKMVRPGNGFVPNFPVMQKSDVNGANQHALYTYLKDSCPPVISNYRKLILWDPTYTDDVMWNYEKFLVGPDGRPMFRYADRTDPGSDTQMHADIAREVAKLQAPAPVIG